MSNANRLRALCLLLATLLTVHAQAQFSGTAPTSAPGLNVRQPLTTDLAVLYPPDRETRLDSGDLVRVSVYGVLPEYLDVERVSLEGTVRLHLAGVVDVKGLSIKDAEAAISARFEQEQTFHNAQVSVELTEAPNHFVTLIGVVRGTVPVISRKRLYDVLAAAGGLPPTASTVLTIVRPGNARPIVVDVGSDPANSAAGNVPVFPGDTITVGSVGQIFVVGAVSHPTAIPLNGAVPTTVLQAVTAAGGTTYAAKKDDTRLVRTTGDKRTVVNIKLSEIMKGHEGDITLQSDDIVLIPSSAIRDAIKNGGITTAIAVLLAVQTFR